MIQVSKLRWAGAAVLFGYLALGCGVNATGDQGSKGEDTSRTPLTERLNGLNTDLGPGDSGDSVLAVQEYLEKFGYLPNAELGHAYPAWRPLVNQAINRGVFDDATQAAVRILQVNSGLADTGLVDAATRDVLRAGRCAEPDGIQRMDASEKFVLNSLNLPFASRNVSWKVQTSGIPAGISLAEVQREAKAAFDLFQAQTSVTFTDVTGTNTAEDLLIYFGPIDGSGGVMARADGNPKRIIFDSLDLWSMTGSNPESRYDFQTVALHEIGHQMGLAHSSIPHAVMRSNPWENGVHRVLEADDRIAVSTIWDVFEMMPGTANDIAVGGGALWIIGTSPVQGGYTIFKWNGSSWGMSEGGAKRIAVDPSGVPWIVNDIGEIYKRTSNSPSSGGWAIKPGCAKDIGIGANNTVWIIGCSPVNGGFDIHKWNGSGWDVEYTHGGGTRISVNGQGVPWIVNNAGSIFRRSSASPSAGFWEMMPDTATDIGVWNDDYPWIVGTTAVGGGYQIRVWNEQPAGNDSPAQRQWLTVPGGATQIAVGADGAPVLVNSSGSIFRTPK